MTKLRMPIAAAAVVALAGCETPMPTAVESSPDVTLSQTGQPASSTGGGFLDFGGGLLVQFGFSAIQQGPGLEGTGQMRFSVELGGELIEFHGETTCMAVDPVEGRAWIGGVITQNRSTHPGWTTPVHEVGKDIWFRVLDSGEGDASPADRSTFVGFEGGGGIITSAEYCQLQIWPDDNARTVPQSSGNITVRD